MPRPRPPEAARPPGRTAASAPRLHGQCARADLLLALARGAADGAAVADLLGFVPAPPDPPAPALVTTADEDRRASEPAAAELPAPAAVPLEPARFWLPAAFAARDQEPLPAAPDLGEPIDRAPLSTRPPVGPPLAPWRELRTSLQPHLTRLREGQAVDTQRLVERLSRGRQVLRIPRCRRRRPYPLLSILVDRSEHLVPYWNDQDALIAHLVSAAAPGTLRVAPIHEARDPPGWPGAVPADPLPPPGSLLLVLGDLGCLRGPDPVRDRHWVAYGRALRQAKVVPLALLPCAPARCPAPLRSAWQALPWERPRADPAPGPGAGAPLADLLERLSPAIRLEPGLVRAVRRLLPAGRRDPGLESDLWQHPAILSTHSDAATWDPDQARRWRLRFESLSPEERARLLRLQQTWRRHLPREIWFEELLSLDEASRTLEPVCADAHLAERFFLQLTEGVLTGRAAGRGEAAQRWFRRTRRRLSDPAYRGPVAAALHRLTAFWDPGDPDFAHKPGYDPRYASAPGQEPRTLVLGQSGDLLLVQEGGSADFPGSPWAALRSGTGEVSIGPVAPGDQADPVGSAVRTDDVNGPLPALRTPRDDPDPVGSAMRTDDQSGTLPAAMTDPTTIAFWDDGECPSWAQDWGWDQYGAWVAFALPGKNGRRVTQRMRWIEPGRFRMGSPADEPGRWQDEGPPHQVTLAAGYWLFDTPCTQDLWEAVMGENPSRFRSPGRPVEQVTWEQVQGFIARLNERLPGLGVGLPSEAQWEYACRAGTEGALYTGPIAILGSNNAPALDPIAWYGGNSGVDFELEDGSDSSGWPERQYPHVKSGTHPVRGKRPNDWGLYDMLGNVYEWVQDPWHDDYTGAPADGSVWESSSPGASRVVRGGSWRAFARRCRCAFRSQYAPDYRDDALGFRCARVQVREPGQTGGAGGAGRAPGAAERAGPARPGPRSGSGRAWPDLRRAAGVPAPPLRERPPGRDDSRADIDPSAAASQPPGGAASPPPGATQLLRLDGSGTASGVLPLLPAIQVRTDRERLTLHQIAKPDWAGAIGRDRFGLWAEIAVRPSAAEPAPQPRRWWSRKSAPKPSPQPAAAPVIQRLRWIPPGRFLMGSPADEPGRWEGEGPRHQVSIARGYWLFDTPCTQALWSVVMDENPSRFKDPRRPVEQVNWTDAQAFIARIEGLVPGLGLTLPTEAQWEHACRAGTATALYTGLIAIRGARDAPALDPIAWYGGNSGVGFELADGYDSADWSEQQYPNPKSGTHPVGQKQPNSWGLYDMLGNVWEWVADPWHDNYEGAPDDGSLWSHPEAGASRVVRGGSWGGGARGCRCAYRVQVAPALRDGGLGFRCARVQES